MPKIASENMGNASSSFHVDLLVSDVVVIVDAFAVLDVVFTVTTSSLCRCAWVCDVSAAQPVQMLSNKLLSIHG